MNEKDKQLLLKDLYARLPYHPILNWKFIDNTSKDEELKELSDLHLWWAQDCEAKPYLRPMSSMTDEERKEYESFIFTQHHEWDGHGTSTDYVEIDDVERYFTWLNKKGFDYRGLIPMGLALEAPEGMYNN